MQRHCTDSKDRAGDTRPALRITRVYGFPVLDDAGGVLLLDGGCESCRTHAERLHLAGLLNSTYQGWRLDVRYRPCEAHTYFHSTDQAAA